MRYCKRCLVYIEEEIATCPLCQSPLVNMEQEASKELFSTGRLPKASEQDSFWIVRKKTDKKIIKKRIFGFYTILNIAAILILIGINIKFFPVGHHFFSYKPVVSLVFSYWIMSVFWHLKSKTLACWLMGLLISFFLMALDIQDGKITWAIVRGLPITWSVLIPFVLPATAWHLSHIKGYNVIGWFALSLGLSLLLIDLAINTYGWSIITLGVFISLALLFFYMHYILKMHLYLDRLFQLKRGSNPFEDKQ